MNEELESTPESLEQDAVNEVEQTTAEPTEEQEPQAPPTLEEQLEQAQKELAQSEDKYLRLQAELVNFRRRKQEELDEFRKYQGMNIVRDLLGPLDNLQRAVDAAEQGSSIDDLKLGVQMVAQQFVDTFGQFNVQKMATVGQPFDPNFHEALQQEESSELQPMTVMRELECGFRMHDRVVRPAKVVVSKAPEAAQQTEASPEEQASES